MNVSALGDIHRREAQAMEEYHGWQLPAIYTGVDDEFEAATTSASIIDLSCYGRIEITGADRTDLLHRLSTNDLLKGKPGEVLRTVLVTDKGRLIDLLLLSFSQASILAITSPNNDERVVRWIDKYTITENIELRRLTSSFTMFCLIGPKAYSVYESLFPGVLVVNGSRQTTWREGVHHAVRASDAGIDIVYVLTPNADAPALWEHVCDEGNRLGLRKMGVRSYEALRVAYGIPSIGSEITEAFNPFEIGLRDAISFTKGCYIGQEVIARLDTYGKVQKILVGLEFKSAASPPEASSDLILNGRVVGTVSSVLPEKLGGRLVGLGVVRLDASAPGTSLNIQRAASPSTAIVTNLPMRG